MLAEHIGSSKRGIIDKSQLLIKQYLMKSIVFMGILIKKL
jgi:hypothetical protein